MKLKVENEWEKEKEEENGYTSESKWNVAKIRAMATASQTTNKKIHEKQSLCTLNAINIDRNSSSGQSAHTHKTNLFRRNPIFLIKSFFSIFNCEFLLKVLNDLKKWKQNEWSLKTKKLHKIETN